MTNRRRADDPEDCDQYTRRGSHWSVEKKISIPTLAMLIGQSVTIVWSAATIYSRVETLKDSVVQNQTQQASVDARQDAEALRAEARISTQIDRLGARLERIVESRPVNK